MGVRFRWLCVRLWTVCMLSVLGSCCSLSVAGAVHHRRRGYDADARPGLIGVGGGLVSKDGSSMRGGGGRDMKMSMKQQDQQHDARELEGMSLALFLTYFSVMASKCSLPSTLSMLMRDLSMPASSSLTPQQYMAKVLASSTIAIAVGKCLLGPVIDAYGGLASLRCGLSVLALLFLGLAKASSLQTFALLWIAVDFCFATFWPACLHAVHQCFQQHQWGDKVGMIATAARLGNAAAFALFAALLKRGAQINHPQPWRWVYSISAASHCLALALLCNFARLATNTNHSNTIPQSTQKSATAISILKQQLQTLPFWLHFLGRSSLMICVSFLLFVPTYMTHVFHMSPHQAARAGSVFALGCLVSVSLGAGRYASLSSSPSSNSSSNGTSIANSRPSLWQKWKDKIAPKWSRTTSISFPRIKQMTTIAIMLSLSTLVALLQLLHVRQPTTLTTTHRFTVHLTPAMGMILLFVWGLCASLPFYVPPSLYALQKGGKDGSATIADAFDLGGFAVLAWFNGYVAAVKHDVKTAWTGTFGILVGCSVLALVCQTVAIALEGDGGGGGGEGEEKKYVEPENSSL